MYALHPGDGTARRTRSYAFDSAHVRVEPGCTDSVSLQLWLPLGCPVSLRTDLVKVVTTCKIVLTVKKGAAASGEEGGGGGSGEEGAGGAPQYDFLTLEMPCRVVHGFDEEGEGGAGDGGGGEGGRWDGTAGRHADVRPDGSFPVVDIMNDLKALAMSASS